MLNSDIIFGRLKQWKGACRLWVADIAGIEDELFAGNSDLLLGLSQEDYGKALIDAAQRKISR